MILDARTLYDFFVQNSAGHWGAVGEVDLFAAVEELVVTPFVLGELEALVRDRVGAEGWVATLDQLGSGAWTIATIDPAHLAAMRQHVANGATLAAASVAVLRAS